MGDYEIKDIYQGGTSSLEPSYGNILGTYRIKTSNIGLSTDARTANVLKEISESISTGEKTVELTQVSPEVFEAIPGGEDKKGGFNQFKELNRLSKLTGVDISLHAPVLEPSGMTREGWSETNRESTERQMSLAVERAHEINPTGNIPVTFHSSGILPGPEISMKEIEGKRIEEVEKLLVINQETNQINAVKKEEKYYPGRGKIEHTAEQGVDIMNSSEWDQNLSQLIFYKEGADRIITENAPLIQGFIKDINSENFNPNNLTPTQIDAYRHLTNAQEYLKNTELNLQGLFNKAYKYGTKEEQKKLDEFSKEFGEKIYIKNKEGGIRKNQDIKSQSDALQDLMMNLQHFNPQVYKTLDSFSRDKTTTTFANVAFNAYKKFKDSAPIISVENPPVGAAFSRGEDLKNIVEESRKKFVELAVKKGISESEARKQAEKLIGATWDVGHINMLRKHGFEKKELIKETEKVAPFVKHVHLSDNFGFEHTELPMGMGNVPIKEIMEKLGEKGFKGKQIVEALSWWQHFSPGGKQNPPFAPTLRAMGSPIYAAEMAPYWNQSAGLQQGYLSLQGATLPDINYQTFGTGFAQLPTELGGQQGGAGNRMSGRPME